MQKVIIVLLFLPFISQAQEDSLTDFIKKADPEGLFEQTTFNLRIQEPRIQTPERFSEVLFNYETGAFVLNRKREDKTVSYSINEKGNPEIALDGCKRVSDADKLKYGLDPDRNRNYRNYYQYLYGLPMILQDKGKFSFVSSSETVFKDQKAMEYTFQLTTPIFSSIWKTTFLQNGTLTKLDFYNMVNPNEGEYIIFDGTYQNESITIPRFRHWYSKKENEYLGSDIIVFKLPDVKM